MKNALAFLAACALILGFSGGSNSQTSGYPTRSVRIIVPYPAGGPTDLIARLAAQKLSETFGQQFFIENVSGASGVRGAVMTAAAPADGYTLMFVTSDLAIAPVTSKSVQYDAVRDFAPIGIFSTSPSVILLHPTVPAKTLQEF